MIRSFPALAMGALLLAPSAAAQGAPSVDWQPHAGVGNLEALTADEDGSPRETTIWLVVVDGAAYIRTSDTTWGANIVRDPEIALRIDGEEIPVRAHFIEDPPTRERVTAAFREKYGFWDRMVDWVRSDHPKIMRLEPR